MDNYTEKINKRLIELTKQYSRFIIYPFGERGKMAKAILNAFLGIDEVMIVDNKLSKSYKNIYDLDALSGIEFDDTVVLITSENPLIYSEIRSALYEYVPKERCVELFPDIVELLNTNNNKKQQELIMKVREKGLIDSKMIYRPSKTDTSFFLPYVFTDLIQQTILMTDDYFERENLEKVFSFNDGIIKSGIDENVRFIDIGANIGNHALYFTKELKVKKVVSFEPTDETYWILEKNIEINSLEDRVELHKVGISDCESHALATKYSMENLGGISLSETEKGGIQLITLDSMDFDNVYFIKIDVEGMEKRVLIGGINTIRKYHPYIMIESFPQSFSDVKAILEPEGYRYEVLSEGSDYLFIYDED